MDGKANKVAKYVGERIKQKRCSLALSQGALGEYIGVSYQQVQRYENGTNTISEDKLQKIAKKLGVNVDFFYRDMPEFKDEDETDAVISRAKTRPLGIMFIDDCPEDETLFREASKHYTSKISINYVRDPEVALSLLNKNKQVEKTDLIILDINMPKINGLELLKIIKKKRKTINIPVVMLTNSVREKEMQEAYRSHASAFIQKTTDFDTYCDDVKRILDYWIKTVTLPSPKK